MCKFICILFLLMLATPAGTAVCGEGGFRVYPQVRGDHSRHSIPASLRKRWFFESVSGDSWSWEFSEDATSKKMTIKAQRAGDLPVESDVHFLKCTDLEGRNRNILCIHFSKCKSLSGIIGSEQLFYLAEEKSDCIIFHSIQFSSVAASKLAEDNPDALTIRRGRICDVLFFDMSFSEFEDFLSKNYSSFIRIGAYGADRLILTSSPPVW